MTKQRPHIRSLVELEHQERKVRNRLQETETKIKLRVKQLPEEIVTHAVMNIVSAIMDGKALSSISSVLKKIGKSALGKLFKDKED